MVLTVFPLPPRILDRSPLAVLLKPPLTEVCVANC